ncbi:hypothetical protein CG723_21835 [Streptomyces sp. CB01635]|uniref:hypothetical protein n=1 Tax=unclassified Streptomyces TaxID=2593676 RepID=UPI000C280B21|nr:hypothetical protein [Streptomyces sp. CB01635]PJN09834.1 hypothetical protein CG723_21835 [Streptomyces sp. CB01635]
MDLDALRYGNFSALGEAVGDWEEMVVNLKSLQDDAERDLKAKADRANWHGANATVSREFVDKTAGEFADAHTQANSIAKILGDTRSELIDYRQQLNDAIDRGMKKNLTVVDTGNGGFTVTMNIHPDRAAKGTEVPDHSPQDVTGLRDEVQRILSGATESDNTAAKTLNLIVDQATYGFSGADYSDRDAAAKAVKEADDLANLMKNKGDDMTPAEFDRLNASMAKYKNDPLFQEEFAKTLGPKGTLDFWADLSDPSDGGDLQRARRDQLGDFQKNLGMTLAGATQSDSADMQSWKDRMVDLGGQTVQTRGSNVYGFQLMSNIMRTGNYDDDFVNKYGNALVATEKKMKLPDHYWQGAGGPPMPKMNFIGEDFGRDPMTGFMTGLSNSPDAATEFFNETHPQDNAEWVLKERHTFDDTPLDDGDGNQSRDATGRALLAATSGMNPNDPNATYVEHTPENRQALDRSLKYLSETGDDFPHEMRDDMAKVLVNYGDETHNTMSSQADHPDDPRQLDRHQLLEVTKQISRDQDSYGLLNDGLNREIVHDINTDHPSDPKETLQRAGATVGFLEEARYQALDTDKEDPSWKAKWAYHGIGGAVNFIPVVGDAAQRGVDALTYQWQQDEQGRIDDQNHQQNGKTFTGREGQLESLAKIWATANPGQTENNSYTLTNEINAAAFDGNARARGLAGDQ